MTTRADSKLAGRERLIYLTATGLVLAVMVFSIINFTFNDHFPFPNGHEGACVHLGFPGYFKVELTVAKILGVLALLIPTVPFKVKEFAYFGFAITLVSASIAHFGRGDASLSLLFVVDPVGLSRSLDGVLFLFRKEPFARRGGGGAIGSSMRALAVRVRPGSRDWSFPKDHLREATRSST